MISCAGRDRAHRQGRRRPRVHDRAQRGIDVEASIGAFVARDVRVEKRSERDVGGGSVVLLTSYS